MKKGDKFTISGEITYRVNGWSNSYSDKTYNLSGNYEVLKVQGNNIHFEKPGYTGDMWFIATKDELYRVEAFKQPKTKTMKEYKVIKLFPTQKNELKVGDIINADNNANFLELASQWPEYFEEIKEQFKVGDWVIGWFNNTSEHYKTAWQIEELKNDGYVIVKGSNGHNTKVKNIRKATPAEIEAAQLIKVEGIGSNNATLTIKGDVISIVGKSEKLSVAKLKNFFDNAYQLTHFAIGDFNISVNLNNRVFLVGCSVENNLVSINDIQKVLSAAKV